MEGLIFDPDTGKSGPSTGLQPAWSSRDVIAFGERSNIWTINPDGSDKTQLTDDPDDEGHPLWSPDGQQIAFRRGGDLWVMNADGGNETLLAAEIHGHVWSSDGERIAFRRGATATELWVTSADGTDQRLLAQRVREHVWSPDGQRIVFVKRDFRSGESATDVWVVNADGSEETLLAEGAHMPDWQPRPAGADLGPPPSQFCFEGLRRNKRRGIASLVVEVPRPGRVILHRRPGVKRFARAHRDEGKGRVVLKVRPRGKARQRLNRKNRVRVRARVTYRPWVGEPWAKVRRVRLVKR